MKNEKREMINGKRSVSGAGGKITRSRANHNILSRGGHFDPPVTLVVLLVGGIIAQQVLRAQFVGDLGEGVRQVLESVGAQKTSARLCGECVEVLVSLGVLEVEHGGDRVVRTT